MGVYEGEKSRAFSWDFLEILEITEILEGCLRGATFPAALARTEEVASDFPRFIVGK